MGRGSSKANRQYAIKLGRTATTDDGTSYSHTISKYGVPITDAFVGAVGEQNLERHAKAVSDVLDIFGVTESEVRDNLKYLGATPMRDSYFAWYRGGECIEVNPGFYRDQDRLDAAYKASVKSGFHPAGTTSDDIVSHEAGHAIESIIREYKLDEVRASMPYANSYNSAYRNTLVKYYRQGKAASDIVSQACKNIKKTEWGRGKKNAEMIASVSGYAKKNRSETLAEAVADYRRNGAKANPLSKEIVTVARQELNSLRRH